MQFESYIGPGNDGIFALVEITDFTPSTVPDFYAHPEEADGEPATVEWRFVDEDGNHDADLHVAATEADYERITQEAIDVAYQFARKASPFTAGMDSADGTAVLWQAGLSRTNVE